MRVWNRDTVSHCFPHHSVSPVNEENDWRETFGKKQGFQKHFNHTFPRFMGNQGRWKLTGRPSCSGNVRAWTFRVKTVKEKNNITRRKGKQEKSLGRFNQELWSLIENTSVEASVLEQRFEIEKVIENLLEKIRAARKAKTCSHILEGYCHFWKYEEKLGFFTIADNQLGDGYYKQITKENKSYWIFKAEQFYCKYCSSFKRDPK